MKIENDLTRIEQINTIRLILGDYKFEFNENGMTDMQMFETEDELFEHMAEEIIDAMEKGRM